jgi:hypothetical protein
MRLFKLLSLFFLSSYLAASPFTNWVEFPVGSPAYSPGYPIATLPDDYFPSVIFNANNFDGHGASVPYKMWHQSTNGIAISTSQDGITWSAPVEVIAKMPTASHASVIYDKNGFGGGPNFYRMWYWTGQVSDNPPQLPINFVESADGVTWSAPLSNTQDAVQFLVNSALGGQPFYQFYGFGQVLYNPSATSTPGLPYTFPYVAFFDSSAAEIPPQTTQEAVGLAFSNDGIAWTRFGTLPVLIPSGNTADWDGKYAFRASVIQLNGTYHMFYSGSSGINNPNSAFSYTFGVGHASSTDGILWTKDSDNPIFTILDSAEAWRSGRTLAPWVVMGPTASSQNCSCCQNTFLQMLFSGGTNDGGNFATAAIGYATLKMVSTANDDMWLR